VTLLLALDDVGVRYGDVQALQGAALQIRRGDFIALIGANGSGKTTLLQVMHGLVPHSGSRSVGHAGEREGKGEGQVQTMVFQRPFMLRVSVLNNMRLALWLAGVPASQRLARAEQALERAGLSALRDRSARALSGGQQQRLALARAWALKPDLLFLDEPTANLDPSGKKEVEAMLAGFAAEGMTLVMSTHNLGQAKRLATRVVYLDRGIIRADLPTTRFFQDSLDERTELFLKGDLKWEV
jgi:tungstate transport system ATP-binding protein